MLPILYVRWLDAHSSTEGWTALGTVAGEDRVIESVGFHVKGAHKGHIVLALNLDTATDHVGNLIHIPKVNVIEKRFL